MSCAVTFVPSDHFSPGLYVKSPLRVIRVVEYLICDGILPVKAPVWISRVRINGLFQHGRHYVAGERR